MIKSLHIKNITCFKDQLFEFGPLVRIAGPNSSGKTSGIYDVLRALLLHKKLPVDYIRHGTKSAFAEIEWEDGKRITREITKSKQLTYLTYPDGTKSEVYATYPDSAASVRNFTGFQEFEFEKGVKEHIQFVSLAAPQIDYIEGCSPQMLLNRLAKAVGGAEIPVAKISLSKEANKTKTRLALLREQQAAAKAKLDEFPTHLIADIENGISALKATTAELETLRTLTTLVNDAVSVPDPSQEAGVLITKLESDYNALEAKKADRAAIVQSKLAASVAIGNFVEFDEEIGRLEQQIADAEKTYAIEQEKIKAELAAKTKVCEVCGK